MTATTPDDLAALLAATARGDAPAFRRLYERTSAKLYAIILRICRDPGLSQDALQETYIKVWARADAFDPGVARPITWLSAIARNTAIDGARRRRDVALGVDEAGRSLIEAIDVGTTTADPEESRALRSCLGGLEETQRTCIVLAYCGGYSREELSSRFDRPVGTIKTWLHRGLATLKACLDGK